MNYKDYKKLNAMVAKYVMELPCVSPSEVEAKESAGEGVSHLQDPPNYSFDSGLALSIIENMYERGFLTIVERWREGWSVSMVKGGQSIKTYTKSKLALAVCLSSLDAVGISIEEFKELTTKID